MKRRISVLGVAFTGLLLVGAYFLYSRVLTEAYPMVPVDLREAILARLAEEGIWYHEEEEGVVRYFKSDRESVLRIGRVVSEEILPSSRSFAPAPGNNRGQTTFLRVRAR